MAQKRDNSPSPSARYESFTAQNLELYNQFETNELLRGRQIWGCFHGWVILSNLKDDVKDDILWSLWNPLTSKLIRLPPLADKENNYYQCCLSSPPDHDECSVFLLLNRIRPKFVFCRLKGKRKRLKWTEMSYAKQLERIRGSIDDGVLLFPTCYNGKVYAETTCMDHEFVIQVDIMVVRGTQTVITLLPFAKIPHALYSDFPSRSKYPLFSPILKGSYKELFHIAPCDQDETRFGGVDLFKLNMTSMMWEKIEDLKDSVFFIQWSSRSVYYKSVVATKLAGYVHILDKMGKVVVSFHVKDRTISQSSMSCSTAPENQVLVWAMLECRLDVDNHEYKKEEKYNIKMVSRSVKPDETELNSTLNESQLLNLPFHILEKIMEHCVVVEYMQFRATCKSCHLAAPPIQWSKILRRLQTYSAVSPWLMRLDNNRGIMTFTDPVYSDEYYKNTLPELKGDFRICCSMYGWLLMHNRDTYRLWFFNPFTSSICKLPMVFTCFGMCCFSAPSTSPDCMVVGFTRHHVYIHFVSQGPYWRRYSLDYGGSDPYTFHVPTFRGRDMYVLRYEGRIEAFRAIDMDKGDFSREVVIDKIPRRCCKSPKDYFLSICDRRLLLVIIGESIELFKLNDSTKEWEKLDSLGKHMIYICNASCICLEAKLPGMENKIYFPRSLHNDDTKIVFYSLETCRYHIFDDKSIQESFTVDFSETKQYCYHHAWIEPSWGLT